MVFLTLLAFQATRTSQRTIVQQAYSPDQLAFAYRVQDPSVDLFANCDRLAKSPNEGDRAFASFLRARLYQRQYELSLATKSLGKSFLDKNVMQAYHSYISTYKRPNAYLSDVRFYKAIGYLELGKIQSALDTLSDLKPKLDPWIYVDEIVWTARRDYSLRRTYDANLLRNKLMELIRSHMDNRFPGINLTAIVVELRAWATGGSG